MFQPVDAFDLVELETRVLARWADDDVFGQSLRNRHDSLEWVFYEGPPRPTGARVSTTCGRGSSKTSIPVSTRCAASTSCARAGGTATASR